MVAELYIIIMIYFSSYLLLFCISQYWYHISSHNQNCISQLWYQIFLTLFSHFLKSVVPLVRRFFFTLFCCETTLLLGFGCETTPFLRFRSPFHYTWHFRLWYGFTTPSSGWEYPFYSPFAPLSYPLQYWYLSLINAFIVGLLY